MSEASRQSDDGEILEELVAAALEQSAVGEAPDVDALCAEHPHLRDALRETLGLAESIPGMPSGGGGRDPLLGARLQDRYIVSECIGAGAMGVVYRGQDTELRRDVAIKVLRADSLDDPERAERFVREGDALAALSHPAVVGVFDRGRTDDGRAFLVMEYLAGVPLGLLLERGVEIRDAVRLTADIAQGLEAAHEAGVFHRDVKPSNVLVTDRGPVLIDFGIAALADEATLARGTEGVGTPAYMAPEQLVAGHPAAATADVYGLTATLYHAVTGAPPYQGTPTQVYAAIAREAPRPAASRRAQLPRDLLAILDHGMARESHRRYATATMLREDLQALLEYRPVRARYPNLVARQWRRARRSAVARTVAAIGLISALVLGGLWLRDRRAEAAELARQTAWRGSWSRVEPLLGLWNPADRTVDDPAARDAIRALLDLAVANRPGPVPALVVRAAFAFDHGDRATAAADLAAVAEAADSDVARALATAYREALDDPSVERIEGFETAEPRTADDLYLLAFHEIRRGRFGAARELLARPELQSHDPSLELAMTIRIATLPTESEARIAEARALHDEALEMETRYGMRTAMTAHLRGGALLGQGRYGEAERVIREGLELAPRSASLLSNLGIALLRTGHFAESVEVLDRAIGYRPHSKQSHETRFWALLRLGWIGEPDAYDRALGAADAAPIGAAGQARLRGELEFQLALRALRQSVREPAEEGAEQALAEAAARAQNALQSWRTAGVSDPFTIGLAGKVAAGEDSSLEALRLAADDPEWWKLQVVLDVLPDDALDAEGLAALKLLLVAVIEDSAPEIVIAGWRQLASPEAVLEDR